VARRALTAAAERVIESVQVGDASTDGELRDTLRVLVDAVERGVRAPTHLDPRVRTAFGRRLLEELRGALVSEWSGMSIVPDANEMVAVLAGIEGVRQASEPDWDAQFASRLSAPDGLQLVIEVGHDLRSPLTSILFLAETLQRGQSGPVNAAQHRQLGLIYSAALGLSTMASDVIELARGGRQLAEDRPVPFSVTDILESVHDIVLPMAEEKGLEVRFAPPAGDHRLGHPQALSRVLLNLTTNALKFTQYGHVEITARAVGLTRMEFSVQDTGPGINPAALDTLYQPFRPGSEGTDRFTFSGTGLGLALCRRLVEAMGSGLEFATEPEVGTRFHFSIDLPPASLL